MGPDRAGSAEAQGGFRPHLGRRSCSPRGSPRSWACGLRACLCRDPCLSSLRRKSKAKPNGKKPAAAEEKKVYLEPEYAKSRITDFGFKELVVLPREIDLNEWLASNSAWGRGGAGRGGLSLPQGPPELVPSVCTHKLTEAEARDGQPHRALGSLQRGQLGAGHQGRGRLRDVSVAAGPGWGGPRPGGRLARTCQPGLALGSQNTLRRAVCQLSSEESAAGAAAVSGVSQQLGMERAGVGGVLPRPSWRALGRGGWGSLPSSAPWPVPPTPKAMLC